MDLKKRLTREVLIVGSIFLVIIVLISSLFLVLNNSSEKIMDEVGPTSEALQHILLDTTRDNLIIIGYLQSQTYSEAAEYDKELRVASSECKEIENNMQDLIISGVVSDPEIIEDYRSSRDAHDELGMLRNELVALHKEELATDNMFSEEKLLLIKKHRDLFETTSDMLIETIDKINQKNAVERASFNLRMKMYSLAILVVIMIFLIFLIAKFKRISKSIIAPIDETINKTQEFVSGNYDARIKPSKEILEIASLQKNINNVFKAIKESSKNPKNKGKIESTLLRKESHDIINFLKQNVQNKKQTTIKDLKSHLDVTHPTILSRLKSLELKGFIKLEKQGREKFIILTSKSREL